MGLSNVQGDPSQSKPRDASPPKEPGGRILAGVIGACSVALWFQPSFAPESPDVAFHTAKVLRSVGGEYFIDPFAGVPTLYPSLFHAALAWTARLVGTDAVGTMHGAQALVFPAMWAAYVYLLRDMDVSKAAARVSAFIFPVVLYAPTSRYVLLVTPANFSFPFLLCGLGLAIRPPSQTDTNMRALLKGLCLALAVALWWPNAVVVAALCMGLLIHRTPRPLLRDWRQLLWSTGGALPAVGFVAWQLWQLRALLLGYTGYPRSTGLPWQSVVSFCDTLVLRGSSQFFSEMRFWSQPTGFGSLQQLFALLMFVFAVVPLSLLILYRMAAHAYSLRNGISEGAVQRELVLTVALLILAGSVAVHVVGKPAHVQRVQFVAFALALPFVVDWLSSRLPPALRSRMTLVSALVGVSMAIFVVCHWRPPFVRYPSARVIALASVLQGLPEARIFMLEHTARLVAPVVRVSSFVGYHDGLYYNQDARSSADMLQAYELLRDRSPRWSAVARSYNVRYLLADTQSSAGRALWARYWNDGSLIYSAYNWRLVALR